jgi:hypothetical protein
MFRLLKVFPILFHSTFCEEGTPTRERERSGLGFHGTVRVYYAGSSGSYAHIFCVLDALFSTWVLSFLLPS